MMVATRNCVLVVEDDADTSHWLQRLLNRYSYDVEVAPTLVEAVDYLDHARPCCILLDLGLPDGNGVDILRLIKSEGLPIKVAVLSGADASLLADAAVMRPQAFFTKPVDAIELITWLASVCQST